ncbi:MAG: hypothetical protein HZB91_04825 [Elusimicrobia bacterium]|nr:hypothetical protein [Elusimicrobiota bacterium]
MKRFLVAGLAGSVVLSGLACRKQEKPLESALRTAMRGLHAAPPCDSQIPAEWPASWPVPTGDRDGREFRVFFYPLFRGPGGQPEVFAPMGEAVFSAATGMATTCRRASGTPSFLAARRWHESTDSLTIEEFELLAARLLAAAEDMGRLFAAQRPPSQDEARRVREFRDLFDRLAEPALRGPYTELSPDFWHWVHLQAGPPPGKQNP